MIATSLTLLTPIGALIAAGTLVPLAVLLVVRRRARSLRGALGLSDPGRRGLAVALVSLLAAGMLVGLAAAQPIVERTRTFEVRTDAEVFVVIDVSRSMLAQRRVGAPMRIARAKVAARELRASLGGVPVGLASLTDRVLPHLFPNPDEAIFRATIDKSIGIERPPPGGTFRTTATRLDALTSIRTLRFFSPTARRRLLIVLTDGESLPVNRARLGVQLLRDPRIDTIFVQFWGSDERVFTRKVPERQYLPDPSSRRLLDGVARATGASVYTERDVGRAARKALTLLGNGPTVVEGEQRSAIALAPYLAFAAFVPLGLLLWKRDR